MPRLDRLQAKFDAMAAPQLRAELDRLQQAIDEATSRAEMAEQQAEYWACIAEQWREDFEREIYDNGGQIGLTQDGRLVAVNGDDK